MQTDRAGIALCVMCMLACGSGPVWAEEPLSAIDWLSESVSAPPGTVLPTEPDAVNFNPGPPNTRVPDDVSVSVIGAVSPDSLGLLAPEVTGLPKNLWGFGLTEDIAAAITTERTGALPALQSLLLTLLLAEADAPADAGGRGILLLARIDKLLAIGALDQASALLTAAGDGTADLFRRSFDVSLLLGSEDGACEKMRAVPELAPTFPARVFCLARAGDWNAAALSLRTGQALGQINAAEELMLARFLDPELAEEADPLPLPDKPTPLILRIYEAIGEPLPTQGLPVAFSHADLNSRTGWKAQLEAAERLTRVGAIAPNTLLGLYTERQPAASGGVWDRVDAFQDFDKALQSGDVDQISKTLPLAWTRMTEAELEVPFATLFAKDLTGLRLKGASDALAFRIILLSDQYERAALARTPQYPGEAFLIGLARGQLEGVTPPDALARAIAPAFLRPDPSVEARTLMEQGRIGEAVLYAIDRVQSGSRGDLDEITEGLAVLRMLRMEDAARRTAIQLILLDRRG